MSLKRKENKLARAGGKKKNKKLNNRGGGAGERREGGGVSFGVWTNHFIFSSSSLMNCRSAAIHLKFHHPSWGWEGGSGFAEGGGAGFTFAKGRGQ